MAAARVVIVKAGNLWTSNGAVDPAVVTKMFARGFALLTGEKDDPRAVSSLFRPNDRVGIKVNTIGGKALSTRPDVALPLASWLSRNGLQGKNLFIWDRTTRELRDAGYGTSAERSGIKVFGTDADGVGYDTGLVSHLGVGSLYSKIQTEFATASVSLAILKDHGLAGVTAGMKNYFGAIHNPNKYHDFHCNPFVAEVFDAPPVKGKHKVSIIDAIVVQYHKGPSFHARWATKYGRLIFSLDPVAADTVGWNIIERLRADGGLPTLQEEGREPAYLATAEKMGLGRSSLGSIETVEEMV
ncbi:MAG: DUF362 domain-containing protein [Candidatus Aminicenantes bacterium]|nr:DUF362 domain-containing protein [Candidatus Aminicenantes bacterium]MCJ7484960.1 DUF362 domain-containing protein [Candidatus Aminicenantes bacterium]